MRPGALNTPIDPREPVLTLPARPALLWGGAAAAGSAVVCVVVLAAMGRRQDFAAGVAGAVLAALVTSGSVLALRPATPRPVSTWCSLWLAAVVGRLIVTPLAAYLLYSAAPLALAPLMLSVAATYVVLQLVEAAVLAAHLQPPPTGTDPQTTAGGDPDPVPANRVKVQP